MNNSIFLMNNHMNMTIEGHLEEQSQIYSENMSIIFEK